MGVMGAPPTRYARAVKLIREAGDLARSGALVLDDGNAAIYFLWGQPSHAFLRRDEQLYEGDVALKEIALELASSGTLAWNNKDVLQIETLRCSTEDLIHILQSMATAGTSSPAPQPVEVSAATVTPGSGSSAAEVAEFASDDFPLLPSGPSLWSDVPTSVVHLDVLLGSLPTVLVRFEAPGTQGAGLVVRGELFDAIVMTSDRTLKGKEAWDELLVREDGLASAYEISEDLAEALPILWRSRIVNNDLESRWFDPHAFLEAQLGATEDRAVIINSEHGMGVGVFMRGGVAGSYTTNSPSAVATVEPLTELIGHNFAGRVTILERRPDDAGDPVRVTKPKEAPVAEVEELEFAPIPAAPPVAELPAVETPVAEAPVIEEPLATEPAVEVAELEMAEPRVENPPLPPVETLPLAEIPLEPIAVTAPPVKTAAVEEPPLPEPALPVAEMPEPTPQPEPAEPSSPSGIDSFQAMADAISSMSAPAAAVVPSPEPLKVASAAAFGTATAAAAGQSSPVSYDDLIIELTAIGTRFLGRDFGQLAPIFSTCEHSPRGLRQAITAVRDANLPSQPPDRLRATARAMQLFVAERITAA